jgi:hypothetical protein
MRAKGPFLVLLSLGFLFVASASIAQDSLTISSSPVTTISVSLSPTDSTLLSQAKALPPPPSTMTLDEGGAASAQQTFDTAGVDVGSMANNAGTVWDMEKVRPDLDKLAKAAAATGKKSRTEIENLTKKVLDKRKQGMDDKIKGKTGAVEDRNSKIMSIEDEMTKVKGLPLIGFSGLYPNTKLVPELAGSKAYTTCSEIQAYADKLDQKRKEHATANQTDLWDIQKTMKDRESMFAGSQEYVQKYADSIASMVPAVQ